MNNIKIHIALVLPIFAFCIPAIGAEGEERVPSPTKTENSCPLPPMPPAESCLTQACAARAKQMLDKQLECHKKEMEELQSRAITGIDK